MANIREELSNTIKLLQAERKEDLVQFKKLSYRKSIKEKKDAGICWYPIHLVKVRWAFTEKLIVEIEKNGDLDNDQFQSGKPVALFSNLGDNDIQNSNINGIINSVGRQKMVITLHTDKIPKWIKDGKLGVELMFDETSYRIMEESMRKVIEAEDDRLATLRDILLGKEMPGFGSDSPVKDEHLNPGQNEALNLIHNAADLAIVHGPPGTGKTTTLVHAILQELNQHPQVLVSAPSNAAVDLLVDKLMNEGVDVLRLGHPARVDDDIISQTIDAKMAQHSSFKDYKKLKKAAEELRRKAGKHKRNFGPSERAEKKNYYTEAKRMMVDADNLYNYMLHTILTSSQVIACTLVGAASQHLKGKQFPVVFIDESAQALEPAAWIPIIHSDKVVMAGDHCQLPPTIKSNQSAGKGLKETLFEKCIVKIPQSSHMLSLQYRMPGPIMAFPNRFFYSGDLQAADNTLTHFLNEDEPVMEFIDTSGSGFGEHLDKESMSIQNKEEGRACLGILTGLLKRTGLRNQAGEPWKVGVIAPYRAQVRLLKSEVAENSEWVLLKSMGSDLVISSVDGFQGQEKDIIMISLTRSNPTGEIGFLADTRRMNVALTRAKRKLLVVGDGATLGTHPFYEQLIDHYQNEGYYKSIYEYMTF